MKLWPRKGGRWELHPCTLPTWEDIPTNWYASVVNNTWKCHCGRRWTLTEVEKRIVNDAGDYVMATEYVEELDFTDDDMAQLSELANEGFWK